MNRHRTDAVSLAFGAIFLLVAGWWLISRAVQITLPTVGWMAALGLIVLGAVGVFGTLRGHRHEAPAPDQPPWPDEPVD
jgi:hypothetical protein